MKIFLLFIIVVSFAVIGFISGFQMASKYGYAAVSSQRATQLLIDLKNIDLLRSGDTGSILTNLVDQTDYCITMLTAGKSTLDTNAMAALSFATTYRQTNSRISSYRSTKQ